MREMSRRTSGSSCSNSFYSKCLLLLVLLLAEASAVGAKPARKCQRLEPSPLLEPFVDELPQLPEIDVSTGSQVTLGAYKIKQKVHRDLPETVLYSYGTSKDTASSPGPTLVATRGIESFVRWENHIHDEEHFLKVDNNLQWAKPRSGGVPIVSHLHGGHVVSESDGHPDAWFTSSGIVGPSFTTQNYTYANTQPATMLWYHDHTVGITRLNVVSGLFGLYLLRSPPEEPENLPKGEFEKLLVLQDKQFHPDGRINFPSGSNSPLIQSIWCPDYYGDTILVNGKAWPYIDVYPTKYRFRVLNGANGRYFMLALSDPKLRFIQIGTDGGFLHRPRQLKTIIMAPAERVDIIIDFREVKPGRSVILNNTANAPYPGGDPIYNTAQVQAVLMFNVIAPPKNVTIEHLDLSRAPLAPRARIDASKATDIKKMTVIQLDADANGNPTGLLNGLTWNDPLTKSDFSMVNTTEIWEIVNLTEDSHPVHIHLITFLVMNQQSFDIAGYQSGNCTLDKDFPDPTSCYTEPAQSPGTFARGWKDTTVVNSGKVTRLLIQWTARNGEAISFDATSGPGYLWHCHILYHEDNAMMRPHKIINYSN